MSKPKNQVIERAHLEAYRSTRSEFAFEMKVLSRLSQLGFSCEHSGTYSDPVTEKVRQFDIRARIRWQDDVLSLAVECKSLLATAPLVLSRAPRKRNEAFHQVMRIPIKRPNHHDLRPWVTYHVRHPYSAYKVTGLVGKKMDIVSCSDRNEFVASDRDIFDKFSQSLSSCFDLIRSAAPAAGRGTNQVVVPVVVVPDGMLWGLDYDAEGGAVGPPQPLEKAEFFVSTRWASISDGVGFAYRISHVEIVTFSALRTLVDKFSPVVDVSTFEVPENDATEEPD
jgi:hypothetical protein